MTSILTTAAVALALLLLMPWCMGAYSRYLAAVDRVLTRRRRRR